MKEETLGKRIAAHRKAMKLTQETLAERLGVTAQAVSKWENDQSCPDIAMIPKLAALFGVTTDALLGMPVPEVHEAEVVEEQENEGVHIQFGNMDMKLDQPRKGSLMVAVWVLLAGALLLVGNLLQNPVELWTALWTTALTTYGIFGLWPKFSSFRLGCALFGAYFILSSVQLLPFRLDRGWLMPLFLLVFGVGLLVDALCKKKNPIIPVINKGERTTVSSFETGEEEFECSLSFGENRQRICMNVLSGGSAEVAFGDLTVDLSGCEHITDGCELDLTCAFGQLTVLVPSGYTVRPELTKAFASFCVKGQPALGASRTIRLEGNASFGQITVEYLP